MILNRISVRGFRCFRNPVELSGLGIGAHVLHAPNETGKSTLLLALARALFDRYGAKGPDMEALRPWGTDLSPRITVDFEVQGKKFRLDKAFLNDPQSALHELRDGRFELCAEASSADDRVRELLTAELPSRGASELSDWGLARLLWLTQDTNPRLPGVSEPLRQRLLGLVGTTALSEKEQALIRRIEEVYEEYFTAAKGIPRKGGPLFLALEKVSAAETEVEALNARFGDAERFGREIAGAETRLGVAAGERAEKEKQLAALEEKAQQEQQTEHAAQMKREEARKLELAFEALRDRQKQLAALDAELAKKRLDAEKLLGRVAAGREAHGLATAEQKRTGAELSKACDETRALEAQLEKGRALEWAKTLVAERDRLAELLGRAKVVSDRREALRAEKALPAPSASDVAAAEELEKGLVASEASLEALSLALTFTAEKALTVEFEGDGKPEEKKLGRGATAVFRGLDKGALVLPGVGRLEVRTGARDAHRVKEELDEQRSALTALLERFAAGNAAGLRKLRDASLSRVKELATLEQSLSDLTGKRPLAKLQEELPKTTLQAQEALAVAGLREEELASARLAQNAEALGATQSALRIAKAAQARAEQASKDAERRLTTAEQLLVRHEAEREASAALVKTLEGQREERIAAHGAADALAEKTRKAAAELDLAQQLALSHEKALLLPADRASTRLAALRATLATLARQEAEARDALTRARTSLENAAADGLYTKLAVAEEKLALAKEELETERRKADAAARLRKLAAVRQASTSSSLVTPIEDEVRRQLRHLRGPGERETEVLLGQDLASAGIRAGGGVAPLSALSWGTQEQAMLALRLTLGRLLSGEGESRDPQLVVLDDALVNTDDVRAARAMELIGRASESLQVLILTAFPERYRALKAKHHDLAALLAARPIEISSPVAEPAERRPLQRPAVRPPARRGAEKEPRKQAPQLALFGPKSN